ncbi:MAG: hypothetical protein HYZ51_04240 [Candidatus Doudnabacteria bacterium]|nr:hypothetical protein [Candidatus Doudnabacteria bacterium]
MFQTHKILYFVLAIIAAFAAGAGLLFAIQNFKTEEEIIATSNFSSPRNGEGGRRPGEVDKSIVNWQTYRNEEYGFEFRYPDKLELKEQKGKVILKHQIPYKNYGDCDMLGGEVEYSMLDDFVMTIELANGKKTANFVDGSYKIRSLAGVYNIGGPEGCGETTYYFPAENKTLIVSLTNVQALSGISAMWDVKEILAVPGAISPGERKTIFNKILSTFKFINNDGAFELTDIVKGKIVVGDKLGDFKIKSIKPMFEDRDQPLDIENIRIQFEGSTTVDLDYEYSPEPEGPMPSLILTSDAELTREKYLIFWEQSYISL